MSLSYFFTFNFGYLLITCYFYIFKLIISFVIILLKHLKFINYLKIVLINRFVVIFNLMIYLNFNFFNHLKKVNIKQTLDLY